MSKIRKPEQLDLPYIGKWLVLASAVALLAGSASAVFLFSLDHATQWRESHRWAIWLLPLAGFAVGLVYHLIGKPVDAGKNLLIDEIHDPKKTVPLRMMPLVLAGMLISHLFGASVGREGTAVQMGGALADQITYLFRLRREDRRIMLWQASAQVSLRSSARRWPEHCSALKCSPSAACATTRCSRAWSRFRAEGCSECVVCHCDHCIESAT